MLNTSMGIFAWLKKKKQVVEGLQYTIILHHNNNSTIKMGGVSKGSLIYIQNNVGRDAIYSGQKLTINLHDFCIVEIESEDKN